MVKLGTAKNTYVHLPLKTGLLPGFDESLYRGSWKEVFDHLVACIRKRNFKADAADLDGAFVLEFSFPGIHTRSGVKIRLVIDRRGIGRVDISSPGPKGKAESFGSDLPDRARSGARFAKGWLDTSRWEEVFDHIVTCIRDGNFKSDAAELDGAFVVEFSFPGIHTRSRVKIRLVIDHWKIGLLTIDSPGPRRKGAFFSSQFYLW